MADSMRSVHPQGRRSGPGAWASSPTLAGAGGAVIGAGLVILISFLPGPMAAMPFGVVRLTGSGPFTGLDWVPAATVSGDVHLNVTGSWVATGPTWQVQGFSEPYTTPVCYPYCGNGSTQGVIHIAEDFCTDWGGGATSYGFGPTLVVYVVFAGTAAAADAVQFNLTVTTTPSTACV